jgi:hypothetical protein
MIAVTSLALAAIVVSFCNKLYRPLRARIFSCIGLNGNKGGKNYMENKNMVYF